MDCTNCPRKDSTPVQRSVLETVMARNDKINRRDTIIIIILILLFVATNAYWIWRDNQFVDVVTTQTVTQDAENGINRFVGGDYYGNEAEPEDYELVIQDADS